MDNYIYHMIRIRVMKDTTTIKISRVNRQRIAKFGEAGESLNDALSKALDFAEGSSVPKNEESDTQSHSPL